MMPGEHWCSICEKDVSKHKDTYVKLHFNNFDEKKTLIVNIVCPDCREKDADLNAALEVFEDIASPVDELKGAAKCSICGERLKRKEKYIRAEFRQEGKEHQARICESCQSKDHLTFIQEVLKPKKQNPTFEIQLICLSSDDCGSYRKPTKYRGINCQNVVANSQGELYCRKAHPGVVKVYHERWALSPTRKQLNEMLRTLLPLYKKMAEEAEKTIVARSEFYESLLSRADEEVQEISVQGSVGQVRPPPDGYLYKKTFFELDEKGEMMLPFGARPFSMGIMSVRGGDAVICLVPVKDVPVYAFDVLCPDCGEPIPLEVIAGYRLPPSVKCKRCEFVLERYEVEK